MKKTENFELNQWESTDRILMDDFNNDNNQIERAILTRLGPIELIDQVDLSGPTEEVILNMTGFNWSAWSILILDLDITYGNYNDGNYFNTKIGGITHTQCRLRPGPQDAMAIFFPGRTPSRPVRGLVFPTGMMLTSDSTWQSVTSMGFTVDPVTTVTTGTTLKLYGIR